MRIVKLRIDGQEFYLPGDVDVDVDALRKQILDAIAGRGDFIDFQPVGYGDVSVLMTPRTKARIEIQEHSEAEVEAWNDDPPDMDIESNFGSP